MMPGRWLTKRGKVCFGVIVTGVVLTTFWKRMSAVLITAPTKPIFMILVTTMTGIMIGIGTGTINP